MFLFAFPVAHTEPGMKGFTKSNVKIAIKLKALQKDKSAWIELMKRHMINMKKIENNQKTITKEPSKVTTICCQQMENRRETPALFPCHSFSDTQLKKILMWMRK